MNVALVGIAKNEDHYIDEWIKYHLKLGFSKIVIYQNDWRYIGEYINDSRVQLIEWDGRNKQLPAYNNFIQNNYKNFDWAGFLDIDEFVVLKQDSNISDFLEKYNDYYSVGLNWSMLGSNGLEFNGEYSVIKRFTRCREKLIREVKCFVNFNKSANSLSFSDPHNISQFNKTISVDKTHFINGYWNKENRYNRSIAYINHYYVKTKEEWKHKMARGWPINMNGVVPNNYEVVLFESRNTEEYNELEDLTAYNVMYGDKNQ